MRGGNKPCGQVRLSTSSGGGIRASLASTRCRTQLALKILHDRPVTRGVLRALPGGLASVARSRTRHVTVIDRAPRTAKHHRLRGIGGENLKELERVRAAARAPRPSLWPPPPRGRQGLAFPHGQVCPRDVRPQNLLRERDGRAKVPPDSASRTVDAVGQETGTGSARASSRRACTGEQIDRSRHLLFGVVLYELLTGRCVPGRQLSPLREARQRPSPACSTAGPTPCARSYRAFLANHPADGRPRGRGRRRAGAFLRARRRTAARADDMSGRAANPPDRRSATQRKGGLSVLSVIFGGCCRGWGRRIYSRPAATNPVADAAVMHAAQRRGAYDPTRATSRRDLAGLATDGDRQPSGRPPYTLAASAFSPASGSCSRPQGHRSISAITTHARVTARSGRRFNGWSFRPDESKTVEGATTWI